VNKFFMKDWIIKNIINSGLFIVFIATLILLILSAIKTISLPNYGFVILPLALLATIIIARGDFSLKVGDLFEIKKEIGSVKDELVTLNTRISNINTQQNITYNYYGSPVETKETNQIASQTDLSRPDIVPKSSSPETQNGNAGPIFS